MSTFLSVEVIHGTSLGPTPLSHIGSGVPDPVPSETTDRDGPSPETYLVVVDGTIVSP